MAQAYNYHQITSVCDRAAQRGRQIGWCQNTWVNDRGNNCLVALINKILGHQPKDELPVQFRWVIHQHLMATSVSYRRHAHARMAASTEAPFVPTNEILFTWNDLEDTTARDVLGALQAIGTTTTDESSWDHALSKLAEMSAEAPSAVLVPA